MATYATTLNFALDNQSLWGSGSATSYEINWDSMQWRTNTVDSVTNQGLTADYHVNAQIGPYFHFLASTGEADIAYPVAVQLAAPSLVAAGQSFTIDTAGFQVASPTLTTLGPAFQAQAGIKFQLDAGIDRLYFDAPGSWFDVNLGVPLGLNVDLSEVFLDIGAASTTEFSGFNDTLTLSVASLSHLNGVAGSAAPVVAPLNSLPDLTAEARPESNIVTVTADLDAIGALLAGKSPQLAAFAQLLKNQGQNLTIYEGASPNDPDAHDGDDISWSYTILDAALGLGLKVVQDVSFDVQDILVTLQVGDEVKTGSLGQSFSFLAGAGSDNLDVAVSYSLVGNLVNRIGVVPTGSFDLSALQFGVQVGNEMNIQFGPLIDWSPSGELGAPIYLYQDSFPLSFTPATQRTAIAVDNSGATPLPADPPPLTTNTGAQTVTKDVDVHSGVLTTSGTCGLSIPVDRNWWIDSVTSTYGGWVDIWSNSGNYTYTIDNYLPALRQLDLGQTLYDTVTVHGTTAWDDGLGHHENHWSRSVTITIRGNNLGDDDFIGTAGNDSLFGNMGYDHLSGGGGNDVLRGGAGSDTIDGGPGDDLIIFSPGEDSLTVDGGTDSDTLSVDWSALGADDYIVYTSYNGNYSTGSTFEDLRSDLASGIRINQYAARSGKWLDYTGIETLQLKGGAANDLVILPGTSGSIDGGAGNDELYADWSGATVGITLINDGLHPEVSGGASVTLANVERLLLATGSGNDLIDNSAHTLGDDIHSGAGDDTIITGQGNSNLVIGGSGNDIIDLGGGAGTVDGGAGSDTLSIDWSALGANDQIVYYPPSYNGYYSTGSAFEDLRSAVASNTPTTIYTVASGKWVQYTGIEILHLKGGAAADLLIFSGTSGAIDGGAGNDDFYADWSGASQGITFINDGSHPDFLVDGASVTVSAVERLLLATGSGDDVIDNSSHGLGDDIRSGAGNDFVALGAGSGTVDGGAGNDTLSIDWSALGASDQIVYYPPSYSTYYSVGSSFEDLRSAVASSTPTIFYTVNSGKSVQYTGIEALRLKAGAGDDLLILPGTSGSIDGGAGNDDFYADWSGASQGITFINDGSHPDFLVDGASVTVSAVERLLLATGSGDDVIDNSRHGLGDDIRTGAGNDFVALGAGSGTLDGGAGNDTLSIDWSALGVGDQIVYYPPSYSTYYSVGSGFEDLRSAVASSTPTIFYTVNSGKSIQYTGIETLRLQAGSGNDLLILPGTGGSIDGGAGNDDFYADWSSASQGITFINDGSHPNVSGGASAVIANVERLLLATGSGDDVIDNSSHGLGDDIRTGAGNDQIMIGAGSDTVDGGTGFDTVVILGSRADFSVTVAGAVCTLTDNLSYQTDTLVGIEALQFADGRLSFAKPNDFDGDGKSDLLWRNTATGAAAVWKSASAATPLAVKTLADQNWQVAGLGDFDGDGKSDILWRNLSTGGNNIWKSANSLTTQATAAFTDRNWKVAGIGDFNGDGKSDILWRNGATATNKIWLSANAATIQNVAKTANLDWQVAGIGDFDGDGKSDILWRNGVSGANLIWKSGNSATALKLTAQTDLNWKVAGIGDFDGDNQSDILWRHAGTGANKIWLGGSAANVQAVTTAGVAWQVLGTGDYDSDGRSDILWRNTTTTNGNFWKGGSSTSTQAVSAQSLDHAAADGLATGDLLLGGTGNNSLIGTLASDSLNGGAGNDTISGGGGGRDTMVGGAGNDTFVIDRVAALTAAITDFVAGQDTIGLAQGAYGGLFSGTSLKAGVFAAGGSSTFASAGQRLQYNTATGGLWYDSDGTGTAAAVQIATLGTASGRPTLSASSFGLVVGQ